ncbi:MAG: 2,3-bisphosphoglycerate-independent phosphoglycerate mutase [Eubacteriales bacterium]|nr:2,3-bisphosphoglycerate-independent phosphoglycerate mutase [Eubacteriales bacterium]MDD4390045.1 2,3-bisphosphoglycerate-independent phosphoglycerate mutase [Eubacteriales bacterium]
MINRPTMLMILDGFGLNDDPKQSAILQANKPNLDAIFSSYPRTELEASGLSVGLPEGQMGNSEVGHLNIGAGRIVYQDLTKISKQIDDGEFFDNKQLLMAIEYAKKKNSALHLMGLVSDGGVHSHITHLFALLDMAKQNNFENVYVHCFLDGRDVSPCSALPYIEALEGHMKASVGKIATVSGRYYAMDRDKRWERIKMAYEAMTEGIGEVADSATAAITTAYSRGENDEFVLPTVINSSGIINDNDAVIMFNFRPDRARQITRALVANDFDGFERNKNPKNLFYVCMTEYEAGMPNVEIAFPSQSLQNTLGEYISNLGLTQLRIAETEKYAHVTFFFNGGIEAPGRNEDRILIPSSHVATYDLKPEMSACEVTDAVIEKIDEDKYDLIILNFANADMVGHTGVMDATCKAVETVDSCIPRIVTNVLEKGGQILLTADHGNADKMIDDDGNTVTAHSLSKVPLVHISMNARQLSDGGKLSDIAPTLLALMGLPIPDEMSGISLLK